MDANVLDSPHLVFVGLGGGWCPRISWCVCFGSFAFLLSALWGPWMGSTVGTERSQRRSRLLQQSPRRAGAPASGSEHWAAFIRLLPSHPEFLHQWLKNASLFRLNVALLESFFPECIFCSGVAAAAAVGVVKGKCS